MNIESIDQSIVNDYNNYFELIKKLMKVENKEIIHTKKELLKLLNKEYSENSLSAFINNLINQYKTKESNYTYVLSRLFGKKNKPVFFSTVDLNKISKIFKFKKNLVEENLFQYLLIQKLVEDKQIQEIFQKNIQNIEYILQEKFSLLMFEIKKNLLISFFNKLNVNIESYQLFDKNIEFQNIYLEDSILLKKILNFLENSNVENLLSIQNYKCTNNETFIFNYIFEAIQKNEIYSINQENNNLIEEIEPEIQSEIQPMKQLKTLSQEILNNFTQHISNFLDLTKNFPSFVNLIK